MSVTLLEKTAISRGYLLANPSTTTTTTTTYISHIFTTLQPFTAIFSLLRSFTRYRLPGDYCSSRIMTEFKQFHQVKALIGPSLLASDMSNLAGESDRVLLAGADFLHLDVMDGHFVPNLTFGAPVIGCLRKNTKGILDVHLMVTHPEKWITDMAAAGTDIFTFHIEVSDSQEALMAMIDQVKAAGMKVGLALKPGTPVESVYPFLSVLDQVLIMTVEPGFGGQKFMKDMMSKVRTLRERCPTMNIEVDGGLAPDTIDEAASAGANMIVAGSAVFKSSPAHVISLLRRSVEKHGNGKADADMTPLVAP